MPRKVLISSRKRMTLMLLGSLVFVALALFLPQDGNSNAWRIYGGGFFALCVFTFAWLIVRPQTLTLDREGFTLAGGLTLPSRVKTIPWRDVEQFFTYRTGRGNKLIAFNFKPEASERTRYARFSRMAVGADAGLPGYWSEGCENVVAQLNQYRAYALAKEPNALRSSFE